MHRFIAVTWNRENPQAIEHARRILHKIEVSRPDIRCVLQADGVSVYCASDSPASFDVYRGGARQMVVLGKVFHREMNEDERPTRVVFDEHATRAVVSSRGRALLEHYWGGYVAFIAERDGSVLVVRDPTGNLPCYLTSIDQVSLVFSCMEDCVELGVRRFSTNWRYVSAFLLRPYIEVRHSGLNEVDVVAPGECLELRDGVEKSRTNLWNLVSIAAEQPIEDVEQAVRFARSTLRGCIGAWASDHPQIIHRLSGGLDSSLVLAGLLHAPSKPEVTCVHHFDHSAGADERNFARLAVEGASASAGRRCGLLEYQRTASEFKLDQLATLPRTAVPGRYVGYLSERYVGPRATSNGRAIQFTGHGGDATFARLWDHAPAVDYVWRHGLGRDLPRVALEAAQGRGTFYGVLSHAIRNGLLSKDRAHTITKQWNMLDSGVLDQVRADAENNHLWPAWRKAMSPGDRRLSPEKIRHLDLMTVSWNSVDPYERVGDWEWFAPINSQPVIELFARLPLYVLMDGAEDRTIARRAFEPYLPAKVVGRRSKSFLDDFNLEVTRHHAQFLRETFLDGVLIRERILDRRKVEGVLSRLHTDSDPIIMRLLGPQLNMEAWLRNWERGETLPAQVTAA